VLLGVTHLAKGELDEAEAAWTEALKIDPSSTSAQMYLRMLASQKRRKSSLPPPTSL